MSVYSPVKKQLIRQGVSDKSGYLSTAAYGLITDVVPVLTVDVLPLYRQNKKTKLGVIIRATGQEKDKIALIGGRVLKNESICQAPIKLDTSSILERTYLSV